MAIVATNLAASGNNADLSSYNTASITPAADALILATISTVNMATTPLDPTLSGNGLTWVKVANIAWAFNVARSIWVYRAMGAAPTSGAVNIAFGESETCGVWCIDQFTGVDTSGTNGSGAIVQSVAVADAGAAQTSLSIALAAFGDAVNNMAFGAFQNTLNSVMTVGGGFTQLGQFNNSSPTISQTTEYKIGEDLSVDITTLSSRVAGIALEIKVYTVPPPVVPGSGDIEYYLRRSRRR